MKYSHSQGREDLKEELLEEIVFNDYEIFIIMNKIKLGFCVIVDYQIIILYID